MKHPLFLAIILTFAAAPLAAEDDSPAHLKTGDTVPDVVLRDADDDEVKLRERVARRPAVLVFYRGGWCPFCTKHLMELAQIKDELLESGHQLLAISPDRPAKIREMPNRRKLGYTLLSDSDTTAAEAFGIAFQLPEDLVSKYKKEYQIDVEAASGESHHRLPHPAVFVVGKDGVIRFAHVNPDYKTRLDPEAILKAANEAP